jgi:predicted glycoside hydrolase/deacetylase ChbG (UPF0249 family)
MSEPRRLWLCADDYGLAPGINRAIKQLILRGRLNATSIMTAAHHLRDDDAGDLALLNAGRKRALLGLHVTLTAPFKPLTQGFAPLRDGVFPSNLDMLQLGLRKRLTPAPLGREIAAQIDRFIEIFGRAPDYLDGHQHVHMFPVVRDAFLQVVKENVPNAWIRQCGRPRGAKPLTDVKGRFLDLLSVGLRSQAQRLGIAFNPAFNGAYEFTPNADFTRLFPRFLRGMPDGGLVMCHPGFVDAALKSLDSLTDLREREFAFLASDAFPAVLAAHGYELADPSSGEQTAA